MIESTLDLEAAKENEFIVRPDFDEALQSVKEHLEAVEADIFREFEEVSLPYGPPLPFLNSIKRGWGGRAYIRVASKVGLEPGKSIKLESAEGVGYFLRVTLKMEKQIRGISWLKKVDMQKAGVRCQSTEMSRLSERHNALKEEYAKTQMCIVKEILAVTAGYLEPLYALGNCTAQLDVVVSLAVAAVSAPKPYVRPRFTAHQPDGSGGGIHLRDFRHPCLEFQDGVSVIPNDVHLERGKQIFKTITGPNMGGKSTYIRGTGVVVAMAQAGSFVPASAADLIPVDAIMARVGAADCQLRGISTFMAEMLETAAVLRLATRDSLVIVDELGRGTSTYDGFGLAWAISEHLACHVGCFSLFATHFHELTSLAHLLPGLVANYRVSAEVFQRSPSGSSSNIPDSDVVMLYKVEPGVCDRSYGLQVARSIGLPSDLVAEAEAASAQEEKVESLWVRLGESMGVDVPSPSQEKSQTDVGALSAVVVAERLRAGLEEVLEQALSNSNKGDGELAFRDSLTNAAMEMLNRPSFGFDSTITTFEVQRCSPVDIPPPMQSHRWLFDGTFQSNFKVAMGNVKRSGREHGEIMDRCRFLNSSSAVLREDAVAAPALEKQFQQSNFGGETLGGLGHLPSLARSKAMSNVPPPSGLSYQVKKKLEGKRDKDQENEALEWIEALTGLKLDRSKLYEDILKDGTVLCKLMNSIKPGCIKKINENATMPFKIMENISAFLEAMKGYGVPVADLFQTVDLFEKKDIAQVTRTLFALGRTCQTHPEYSGPVLGPKLATENKREFTEQQLREGQNVVSLQYGSNKGASQAGINMGKQRMIMD
ncbi:Myophilin [Echinococcus granulosus]|nr:Myophilin [Echinococcus granulosus]EUB57026.1 Myophilin [Echinococcus granulosus]